MPRSAIDKVNAAKGDFMLRSIGFGVSPDDVVLTQDPKAPPGAIQVPSTQDFVYTGAGNVTLRGPILVPGLNIILHANSIAVENDSNGNPGSLSVSGLPGAAPPPPPPQTAAGRDGANGNQWSM